MAGGSRRACVKGAFAYPRGASTSGYSGKCCVPFCGSIAPSLSGRRLVSGYSARRTRSVEVALGRALSKPADHAGDGGERDDYAVVVDRLGTGN